MLSHARLPLFTSLALALALLLAALLSRGSARADRLAATLPPPDAPAWVIWETHPPARVSPWPGRPAGPAPPRCSDSGVLFICSGVP